jgi:hypothetical protein
VTSTRQSTAWPKTHAAKLNDAAVASALDDAAVMRGDGGINEIATAAPHARQGAILVRCGEPTVADDIGDQDRDQFSALAHGACCCAPSRPFQTVPATALGGERKTAKAISLIGLGMAACPCCTDEVRGDRECRPGIR